MSGFDWILLGLIVFSVVSAVAQGFFADLFSLSGAIVGFILASWEYWRLSPWFERYLKSPALAHAAAFLAIFIVVSLVASLSAKIAAWVMDEAGLRWVDRLLGGAFGLVRGLVLATVLVFIATSFTPDAAWFQRSSLAGYFTLSARVAAWAAPPSVRYKLQDGIAYLRKVRQDGLAKVEKNPAGESRHD